MNDDLHHADDSYGYLREALEKNNLAYEPPGFGRRFRTPMFEFVRRVKAHPRFESLAAMDALKLVGDVLAQGKPETADDWKTLFHDSDDPRAEFIDTWDRIKWPRASVEHAQYEAKRLPLKPLICPSDEYAVFVSVAGHLQRNIRGSILLPCHKLGTALGCTPITISRYRRLALQHGLLQLDKRGARAQLKADEFTFKLELFDWKTGQQIQPGTSGCYTETQETQDLERKEDSKRLQNTEDKHENKNIGVPFLTRNPQFSPRKPVYIPTTSELLESLRRTEKLRNG